MQEEQKEKLLKLTEQIHKFHTAIKREYVKGYGQEKSAENTLIVYLHKKEATTQSKKGVSPSILSKDLELSLVRISHLIRSLENKGYLVREEDKKDRRKCQLYLTKQGQACYEEIRAKEQDEISKILDYLGEEDALKWLDIMKKISRYKKEVKETREAKEKDQK